MKELTLKDMSKSELIKLIGMLPVKPSQSNMRFVRSETLEKQAETEYAKSRELLKGRTSESWHQSQRHWERYEKLSQQSIDMLRGRHD